MRTPSLSADDAQGFYDQLATALQVRLIDRIGRHDLAALKDFRRLFIRDLKAFVHARCFDLQVAEDVVDEVFERVWLQSADFDPASTSPKDWLLTIAESRLRALERVAMRHQVRAKQLDRWGLPGTSQPVMVMPAQRPQHLFR